MDRQKYSRLIERIFFQRYEPGIESIEFSRADIPEAARELNISPPKNLGDVLYSFRYRRSLPKSIVETAEEGKEWELRSYGISQYVFELPT